VPQCPIADDVNGTEDFERVTIIKSYILYTMQVNASHLLHLAVRVVRRIRVVR